MLTALQRAMAGATRSGLALSSNTGIAPAALSLLPRAFANDAYNKDEQQATADASSSAPEASGAAAAGSAAAAADTPAEAPESAAAAAEEADSEEEELEVPLENLTRRQRAWLGAEPERYKHFMPKLSRKERGAFGEQEMLEEFDEEVGGEEPTVPAGGRRRRADGGACAPAAAPTRPRSPGRRCRRPVVTAACRQASPLPLPHAGGAVPHPP